MNGGELIPGYQIQLSHERVQELLNQKHYPQAEQLLQTLMQQQPNQAQSYYLMGVSHYLQGRVGTAIENLRKALSINPKHTDSAVCLSVLLNDVGKYDEAKKAFDQANQSVIHPVASGQGSTDPEVDRKFSVKHLEIADLYFRYRRYDEAIEEYSKALRLDPKNLEILIRRAKAYAKKGFLTRSMQELQQLKREHPEYQPAKIQLGLLHYSQGNVLDAELEWEGVIQLDPHHREAQAYLKMAKQARVPS